VIELGENRGFGYAANAGVAAAGEPVTVLANPDVELIDSSLADLDPPPSRLLAPLLLNPDGSRQDSAQPGPGSAAAALYAVVPGPAQPAPLRRLSEPWQRRRPGKTGWAVAALLVARTETLAALGPFDESIFLYAEDLDLGLRAADAGVETWFCPQARAIHSRGHSTLPAFGGEPVELLAKQRHAVVTRRRGRLRAALDDAVQAATFADRRLLKRLARRPSDRERAQLDALRKARRDK
jgi:GT2 family glycosyltransferase